ncbi:MAG: FKBP-type peptidyl-prolyl cis-trans isomerase [Acidimicrobiales bacterium]
MAAKKPNRQQIRKKQAARAARAAELARKRQARKRRLSIAAVVAVVASVGVLAAFVFAGGGDTTDLSTSPSSTPPTSAPLVSAEGKPCVPVADPLPPGAPAVPVKVGPPPTELVTEDLQPGTGEVVAPGANVTVNYVGVSCSTGKIFDSSYKRKQPFTTSLAQVIPGWQQGIPGMKVGGQRLLGIPSAQAYAEQGSGNIAPDEALWFVVEVLEVKPPEAKGAP